MSVIVRSVFFTLIIQFCLLGIIGDVSGKVAIKVLDADTKKAIAYPTVREGKIIIAIGDSMGLTHLHDTFLGKTVTIHCLGYKEAQHLVNLPETIVELKESNYQLNQLIVKPKLSNSCSQLIGCLEDKVNGTFHFKKGAIVAVKVNLNSKEYFKHFSDAFIEQVAFYVTELGHPNSSFRVRVFEVDSIGKPGKDLLNSNVIYHGVDSIRQWVVVDIGKHIIKVPPSGIFVGMEWLTESDIKPYELSGGREKFDGQVLGGTWSSGKSSTYIKTRNGNWLSGMAGMPKKGKQLNAMIKAKVRIYNCEP
jgi:hypothetical protein